MRFLRSHLSPRGLLIIIALELAFVALKTRSYPPDALTFPVLWVIVASVAAVACLTAAWWPSRGAVAAAGGLAMCVSVGRSVSLLVNMPDGPEGERVQLVVAGAVWALVAVLLNVAFREFILPWSLTSRPKGQ